MSNRRSDIICKDDTEQIDNALHAANHARKRARQYHEQIKQIIDAGPANSLSTVADKMIQIAANASAAFALYDLAARIYRPGSPERAECIQGRNECSQRINQLRGKEGVPNVDQVQTNSNN